MIASADLLTLLGSTTRGLQLSYSWLFDWGYRFLVIGLPTDPGLEFLRKCENGQLQRPLADGKRTLGPNCHLVTVE